jgi:hypothetical protein
MATQVGAIRVQIGSPVSNVQVGSQSPKVQSINYGTRALRGSTDLSIGAANVGDVITYTSNGSFIVSNTASLITKLDAGTF